MVKILFENNFASDTMRLGYPNMVMCCALAIQMADGTLHGCHVSPGKDHAQENHLLGFVRQGLEGDMVGLYAVARWHDHIQARGLSVHAKAEALGFHGTAHTVDLDVLSKTSNNTYVDILSGEDGCSIRYKRSSRMKRSEESATVSMLRARRSGDGSGIVFRRSFNKFSAVDYEIIRKTGCFFGGPGTWHYVKSRQMTSVDV